MVLINSTTLYLNLLAALQEKTQLSLFGQTRKQQGLKCRKNSISELLVVFILFQ